LTLPISTASTAPAKLQDRLSVFGRNIAAQFGSELSYLTSGVAPNRTLIVQWKHFRRNTQLGENFNFQIVLHETTNVVEFIYGAVTINTLSAATAPQIGLRGSANTDFNNRTTTTDWSATTAGAVNTASVTISTTVFPTPGLIYRWNPPIPDDAGITAINSPSTSLVNGLNNIDVTIKNFGSDTLKNATIAWSVNGILQTPYLWTGNIALGITNGPNIIGTYGFSTPGIYKLKIWSEIPNGSADLNNINDTATKTVYVKGYATLPFSENFDKSWITSTYEVPSIYWTNSPNTGNSSWRRNDDVTSAAWTNPTLGAYTPIVAGTTVHSARFHSRSALAATPGIIDANVNFSPAGTKIMKFWHINTAGNDSLDIFVSNDNGVTFTYVQRLIIDAAWTQHTLNLGTSTSPNTIIRFKAINDAPANGSTDIGIDSIQVYLQPTNDMAAISLLAPVSGCGHTASDIVTIRIANIGAAAQTNIPVYYSTNGGQTFVGPETIAGPVNSGDTINYTFTQHADLSAAGHYACKAYVGLPTDLNLLNDSVFANVVSVGTIGTFPFTENFNTGGSNYLVLAANADAAISYDTIGTQNTYGIHFTGKTTNLWTGGTTTAAAAYGTYTTHHSNAATCNVNATSLSHLTMKFDLKETSSSATNFTYTWYTVVVNGTDTVADVTGNKYFNPATATADAFATKTFDLSAYAGTNLTINFIASCRRTNTGSSDNVYFDNLVLFDPPVNDVGVTSIIKPNSKMCGIATDSVRVIISNFGTASQTNIPVVVKVTTPSSGVITLLDTLAGPLASNVTDTLTVGVINTSTPGNYLIKAYTKLLSDVVFTDDTTIKTIATFNTLSIPHVEDYQGTPPLINWNVSNFLSGNVHGNTSNVMYATISNTAFTGSAYMNKKTASVTNKSYLSFDYRIVNSPQGTTGTTLTTDSVLVLLSNNCGTSYDTLYVIDATNHVSSATMKKIILPLASYAGSDVTPGFYVKRGTGGTYFLDIDNVAISDAPVVALSPVASYCVGSSIILDAGSSVVGYTYSYLWSTLLSPSIATTQTITVDSSATYIATVNNGYGITASDTIVVGSMPLHVVSLGQDSTTCGNNSVLLNAGTHNSYLWSTGATTQTITIDTLGIGAGTFSYWVKVSDGGCFASDTVNITFTVCAGITELTQNALTVFPNPTSGIINIEGTITDGKNFEITICNNLGKVIARVNNLKTIDMSKFENGIYFLKVKSENNDIFKEKIIIIK